MIEKEFDKRAFSQVIEILNHSDKNIVERIPKQFINFLFENMDTEYNVNIDFSNKNWEETILEETKVVLALIYRDYIVSSEERAKLLAEEKKEQEALELQEEVEHLRQMVKQADIDALVAVAEMYDLTPEELAQMMASIRSDRSQPEADIPDSITAVPAEPEQIMFPEEEDPLDDEET